MNWWVQWLFLEDQMPNEAVIQHRVVVWHSVWELEYIPDVQYTSLEPALSRSRWAALRTDGLRLLSILLYGNTPKDPSKPLTMLSLRERASHSNFSMCAQCAANKKRWIEYRQAPPAKRAAMGRASDIKADIFAHIAKVKAERRRAQEMAQECANSTKAHFQYDDKLGSQYIHGPTDPFGGRGTADIAARYQYRWGLQGNFVPGTLLNFTYVPPCLKTGANFGCTSFLGMLYDHAVRGSLRDEIIYNSTNRV